MCYIIISESFKSIFYVFRQSCFIIFGPPYFVFSKSSLFLKYGGTKIMKFPYNIIYNYLNYFVIKIQAKLNKNTKNAKKLVHEF